MGQKSLMVLGAVALFALPASAQQFSGGMPAGWACVGNCNTLGADGVVTLAPGGGSQYGYVSTWGGVGGVGQHPAVDNTSATNGSLLTSSAFAVGSGDILKFNFNYVTSDGAEFNDYAWARLLDGAFNEVALLFTARTVVVGNTVPGDNMPAPAATLTPSSTPIVGGGPTWSPLGGYSGDCYASGCGYTGWINAQYTIASAGSYYLQFGVTNYLDALYDSGLAFDGITVNDTPISVTPEPGTILLMGSGLLGVFALARRRKGLSTEA
jgi:hypothetical protein